jgi:hypothetical protein
MHGMPDVLSVMGLSHTGYGRYATVTDRIRGYAY